MNNLFQKSDLAYKSLQSALEWIQSSSDSEISSNQILIRNFRYSIFRTKKLRDAASARMCVGVYGASQAGKSYMVSTLAKKKDTPLIAKMGDYHIDFIKSINPPGGKESTGLVTRFTNASVSPPKGFPVQVKLLSELDLVKLLFNSYANDLSASADEDQSEHEQDIQETLNLFDVDKVEKPSPITVEDVFDLQEYCSSTQFSSNIRSQALKRTNFWNRSAELLPKLNLSDRCTIYKLLWENLEIYNEHLFTLSEALEKLGHAKEIFCEANALFDPNSEELKRSEFSIINVSTLDELGQFSSISIKVCDQSVNNISTLEVATLSALTSELVVHVPELPHDIFNSTDLLDFPGARSRKPHPKINQVLADPQIRVENFLRGKVAYLFDKYCSALELTTMLLCIGPSNQEVVGLDRLIDNWVLQTHGATPESRDKLVSALFVVLTKFDQEFSLDAGRSVDGDRWITRLSASLLKPFASHSPLTNWVSKWNTSGPFNNVYWLRNTHADQSGLIKYDGEPGRSKEISVTDEKKDVVFKLRQSFIDCNLVKSHFIDPRSAWDAGMALNDGGSSYLIERLSPACDPSVKLSQINQRLDHILDSASAELKKFYISTNIDELQIEKRKIATEVITLGASILQRKKLGEFISLLLVNDSDTFNLFNNSSLQYERKSTALRDSANHSSVNEVIDDALATILGLEVSAETKSKEPQSSATHLTFSQQFVLDFIQTWRSRVIENYSNSQLLNYLFIDIDLVSKLLNELEISAKRTGLVDKLRALVEENAQYKGGERRSWIYRQTAGVTAYFNDFICHGGLVLDKNSITTIRTLDDRKINIFSTLNSDPHDLALPDTREDLSKVYFVDWLQSIQSSICNNANYHSNSTIDINSNTELGNVLRNMFTAKSLC